MEKSKRVGKVLTMLMLAVTLMLSGATEALAADGVAATMQMRKTEGTVTISSSSGKGISLIKNMRLYNGYQVKTGAASYAWIDLDSTKLVKLDEASEASIRKSGKKLEILLDSGNIYFDVSEPLKDDESLNVRTSTIAVGIRGTSGWVEVLDKHTVCVHVLEGMVEVTVTDPVSGQSKTDRISGGETAIGVVYEPQEQQGEKCDIIRQNYTEQDTSGFVLEELAQNSPLVEDIYQDSGLDYRDLTPERADEQLQADQEEVQQKLEQLEQAQAEQEHEVSVDQVGKPKPAVPGGGGSSGGGTPTVYYMVTFHNAGDSTMNSVQVLENGMLSVPPAPTRAGYTFGGWHTDPACNIPYDFNAPVTGDLALYAKWIINYKVNFIYVRIPVSTAEVPENGKVPEPTPPSRTGYTFAGWYTDTAHTQLYDFNRPVTADLDLYAKFIPHVYKVTFDTMGGPPVDPIEITHGTNWDLPWDVPRDGYVIEDWCIDPECTIPVDDVTSDVTLYAKWAEAWMVTFDYGGAEPFIKAVKKGVPVGKPYGLTAPDPAYPIVNWYADSTCTQDYDFQTPVNGDMTIYAQWYQKEPSGLLWRLDTNGTRLTLTGNNYIGASLPESVEADRTKIEEVVILGDGISSIDSYAFQDCAALTAVSISNHVTSIGSYAFEGCTSLTGITLPDSVTTIEGAAFSGCGTLASINIPVGVSVLGDEVFRGCSSLTGITLPDSVTTIGDGAFQGSGLTSMTIPDSVTTIGSNAFFGCKDLASVNIPVDISVLEDEVFRDCFNLTSIMIPDSVTTIGDGAFQGSGLTSITIPDSVTSMGGDAVRNCTSLTQIVLGQNLQTIGAYAFLGSGFASIVIPDSVTEIGIGAFYGSDALTSVTLSNSITCINEDMFFGCSNLQTIVIPNSVTEIKRAAFYETGLTNITIPGTCNSIASSAFQGCTSLTSVTMEDGFERVGNSGFYNCSQLKDVNIPVSVTQIEELAFWNCAVPISIHYAGTSSQWQQNIEFTSGRAIENTGRIYCSDNVVLRPNNDGTFTEVTP